MKRAFAILIFIAILALFIVACTADEEPVSPAINSYRDIPGITQEEIDAISALRAMDRDFVYAMPLGEETFLQTDGTIAGFSVYFVQWLSEFFDLPFSIEIVLWEELMHGLENGNIDFSGQLMSSPERLEIFEMAGPIASRALDYATLRGAPDLHDLGRAPKFAIFEGAVSQYLLLEAGTFDYIELVYVSNLYMAMEYLLGGYADAFLGVGTQQLDILHPEISAHLVYPPLFRNPYFSAQNPELFPLVHILQRYLENGGIRTFGEFYSRGIHRMRHNQFLLSLSEEDREFKHYFAETPVFHVGLSDANYPISFFNNLYGEMQGVAIDIIRELSQITGLNFEYYIIDSTDYTESHGILEADNIAIIMSDKIPDHLAEIAPYTTTPVFQANFVFISDVNHPNISFNDVIYTTVGVIRESIYDQMLLKYFPELTTITLFPDNTALFEALQNREIETAFSTSSNLLYLNNYLGVPYFHTNLPLRAGYQISFVVPDENLTTIVNHALSLVDIEMIATRWTDRSFDYTSRLIDAQMPWLMSAGALLLVALTLTVALLFHKTNLKKVVSQRTKELEIETTLLETILNAMPDVLFYKDVNYKYVRVNTAFKELFQCTDDEIIGRNAVDGLDVPHEIAKTYIEQDSRVLNNRQTVRADTHIPMADNTVRTLETILTPLITKNDELIGLIGLSRDITARIEAEKALQLASDTRAAFVAHMSHELRTPLNSVIGFSNLAITDASPETKAYLTSITQSANELLETIDNILDLSNISLKYMLFNPNDVIAQCKDILHPKAEHKNLTLEINSEQLENCRLLFGDPERLHQVLLNIIGNSIKFTEIGTIKLLVSVTDRTKRTQTIRWEIEDTGVGLTEEQIISVSEPFIQGDSGSNKKQSGIGLGIPIAKGILSLMGSELKIESNPNIGSRFSFEITFDTVDPDDISLSIVKGKSMFAPRNNDEPT